MRAGDYYSLFILHEYYFALACKKEDIRDTFEEVFPQWARAIVIYSRGTQIRSTALQTEIAGYADDMEDGVHMLHFLYLVSDKIQDIECICPYSVRIVVTRYKI